MKENNPAPWREQEFGDARGTWTVGDLYDHALEHHTLRPIPVAALEENNLDSDDQVTSDPDHAAYVRRAMASDISYPILVISYPDGLWIADGTHRTWKARELGIRHLQGWIMDWEEILEVPHGPPHGDSAASRY